ncbi:sugar ABC transporter ATP-binding protein [Kosmotoga pacifica]|uniref:D-ribose transporter ATP-binding protein n=1 Tax=Kosmotoga pacifica TaxID=1330330 RepID=A0A0G2ZBW4_9BACT|nr:sugar ABC transporter ATP-binding protein [Kosmotoga pacifica]AKI97044.1 D-ribose transporter ATP-binding protein [Kosmotoga pacifica]
MNYEEYAIVMKKIDKQFPGVHALDHVDFFLKPGEAKALVGENGAGKSTLIKILTGAYQQDEGEIFVFGKKVERMSPILSEELGISAVYQNLVLANHLTVAENILLGNEKSAFGFVDKKFMIKRAYDILDQIGYADVINPNLKVGDLSAAQQGMVAIARALSRDAKVIIFDEPTAVLADREVKELFRVILQLKKKGISVIYISHRMEEIFELCDTALVLKDGKVVGERPVKETTEDELITMMVGRELKKDFYNPNKKIGSEILKVEEIENEKLRKCSFSIRSGEIVGIYGLVGSGRTELSRAIFGADTITSGKIFINGKEVKIKSPHSAIKHGIGLIPEDRRQQGLALKLNVKHNINLPIYDRIGRFGFIKLSKETKNAKHYVKVLSIKTPSLTQIVSNLSGGNQQKVVVAKWLASQSKIFIMDEPTNGIDVGAKEEIYELMNDLAQEGAGVVFISSYMPELISICDRILVMREGKIAGELQRKDFSEEKILSIAIKSENNIEAGKVRE